MPVGDERRRSRRSPLARLLFSRFDLGVRVLILESSDQVLEGRLEPPERAGQGLVHAVGLVTDDHGLVMSRSRLHHAALAVDPGLDAVLHVQVHLHSGNLFLQVMNGLLHHRVDMHVQGRTAVDSMAGTNLDQHRVCSSS